MKTIDIQWLKMCYAGSGINARSDGIFELLQTDASGPEVVINTEHMESADLVLLANRLLWPTSEDDGIAPDGVHAPYAFWIRESGIWNDVHEAVAAEAFRAILTGYKQSAEARGLVFDDTDRLGAVVFVLHALLFAWDAYLIPLSACFVCHLSHDGYVQINAGKSGCATWLNDRLSAWESQPAT